MNTLIFIAYVCGALFFGSIFLGCLSELIHMLKDPEWHKYAMKAHWMARGANHGEVSEEAIRDFNQTNPYGFLVKKSFTMVASEDKVEIGGRYYVHEPKRKDDWA